MRAAAAMTIMTAQAEMPTMSLIFLFIVVVYVVRLSGLKTARHRRQEGDRLYHPGMDWKVISETVLQSVLMA